MSSTKTSGENPAAPSFRTYAQQLEKQPPCQVQCPNSGDVRGWIGVIAQHEIYYDPSAEVEDLSQDS